MTTSDRTPLDRYSAGRLLLRLREERELTQAQAAAQVERRAGIRFPAQEISRLEGGGTLTPSMESLVALGDIYGLTPNDVAAAYGYWEPTVAAPADAGAEWAQLGNRLRRLDAAAQARLLAAIDTLLLGEQARARVNDHHGGK